MKNGIITTIKNDIRQEKQYYYEKNRFFACNISDISYLCHQIRQILKI